MKLFRLFLSPFGRLAPREFALATMLVYAAMMVSQVLLSGPMVARYYALPFILMQAGIVWSWLALHVKRLRDAGDGLEIAFAIAILYVLAMALLLLVMQFAGGFGAGADDVKSGGAADLFIIPRLIGIFVRETDLGIFGYLLMGFFAFIMIAVLVALSFSVWAGFRSSARAQQ